MVRAQLEFLYRAKTANRQKGAQCLCTTDCWATLSCTPTQMAPTTKHEAFYQPPIWQAYHKLLGQITNPTWCSWAVRHCRRFSRSAATCGEQGQPDVLTLFTLPLQQVSLEKNQMAFSFLSFTYLSMGGPCRYVPSSEEHKHREEEVRTTPGNSKKEKEKQPDGN